MFVIDLNVMFKGQRKTQFVCESDGCNYSQEHAEYWPEPAKQDDEEGHRQRSNDGKDHSESYVSHITSIWKKQKKSKGLQAWRYCQKDMLIVTTATTRTEHLISACAVSTLRENSIHRPASHVWIRYCQCWTVAVKDLFSRPSADCCLCTCIKVSDLLH